MMGMGPSELLVLMLVSLGGGSADLATLLDPGDYFKQRGVEVRLDKMMELAAAEPKDGASQIAQLLALRVLGDDTAKLKNHAKYDEYRQTLEAIAEGTKAQDKQGFAKEYARRTLLRLDGKQAMLVAPKANWRAEALAWFPASATLVSAFNMHPGGAPGIDSDLQVTLAKLMQLIPVPERKKAYDFVDKLGNIQLQRVAIAFEEDRQNPREGDMMLRVTGRADKARLIKLLVDLGLERKEKKGAKGETYVMLTCPMRDPNQKGAMLMIPPLLFLGDHDVVMAFRVGSRDFEHVGALSKLLDVRDSKKGGVMEGDLKADLQRVPDKANGFLVGQVPREMRKGSPFPMPLRVVAHVQRVQKAMDVQLEGTFENGAQAKEFVATVFRGRTQALEELKKAQGQPLPIPGLDLAPIQQLLESLQVEGKGDTAKLRLLVPNQTMSMAPLFFFGMARGGFDAPPPEKKEDRK